MGFRGGYQDSPKGGVETRDTECGGGGWVGGWGVHYRSDTKSRGGGGGGVIRFRPDTKSGGGGRGAGAVRFRPDTKKRGEGEGGCLAEEGEVPYMKGGGVSASGPIRIAGGLSASGPIRIAGGLSASGPIRKAGGEGGGGGCPLQAQCGGRLLSEEGRYLISKGVGGGWGWLQPPNPPLYCIRPWGCLSKRTTNSWMCIK